MFKISVLFALIIFCAGNSFAKYGQLFLTNGHKITGDIRNNDDGSYWVTTKTGSIRFEKNEVKGLKILSTKDTVSSNFLSSMKITPGQTHSSDKAPFTGYDNIISREAASNNIDPRLVKAVIKAESNYKMGDVSSKGACGLMQLMPETARLLGVNKIFSPEENIKAGTKFLRYMIDAFDGDIEMGLAAYNAGPSAVKRYGTIPPYKETRGYVRNVLKYYRAYRGNNGIGSYTDEKGCLNIFNAK